MVGARASPYAFEELEDGNRDGDRSDDQDTEPEQQPHLRVPYLNLKLRPEIAELRPQVAELCPQVAELRLEPQFGVLEVGSEATDLRSEP